VRIHQTTREYGNVEIGCFTRQRAAPWVLERQGSVARQDLLVAGDGKRICYPADVGSQLDN
jgi:hypothetical protein